MLEFWATNCILVGKHGETWEDTGRHGKGTGKAVDRWQWRSVGRCVRRECLHVVKKALSHTAHPDRGAATAQGNPKIRQEAFKVKPRYHGGVRLARNTLRLHTQDRSWSKILLLPHITAKVWKLSSGQMQFKYFDGKKKKQLTDGLFDWWSIDQTNNQSIDCLIDWFTHRSIDWLIDWFTHRLIDWLIDWLIDVHLPDDTMDAGWLDNGEGIFNCSKNFRMLAWAVVSSDSVCPNLRDSVRRMSAWLMSAGCSVDMWSMDHLKDEELSGCSSNTLKFRQ